MRVAAAILLSLFVGFWAFAGLMGDLGPGESALGRVAYLSVVFVVGGLLVGLVAGRRWWLAGLCAWAPLVRAVLGVYHGLKGAPGGLFDLERAGHLVFALAMSLVGGSLGRLLWRVRSRRARQRAGA